VAELHPPVVHFAIALTIAGVVFEILAHAFNKKELEHAGFYAFLTGVAFTWLAWFTGRAAEELVEDAVEGTPAYRVLEFHETLGTILLVYFTALAVFRLYLKVKESKTLRVLFLTLGVLGAIFMSLQGRLGGILVYQYGVGVKAVQLEKPAEEKEEHE